MDSKSFLSSKTIWFSAAATVASVIALVAGEEWIQEYPQVVSVLGIVGGVITGILRTITTQPVGK